LPSDRTEMHCTVPYVDKERAWKILDTMVPIAKTHDCSPPRISLAWLLTRPAVTSVIVGAKRLDHLEDNLAAADLTRSPEATPVQAIRAQREWSKSLHCLRRYKPLRTGMPRLHQSATRHTSHADSRRLITTEHFPGGTPRTRCATPGCLATQIPQPPSCTPARSPWNLVIASSCDESADAFSVGCAGYPAVLY
jgi:hypothetical protein